MYSRSSDFDEAVKTGGVAIARCDSRLGGVTRMINVPIVEGSVTVDRSAATRRTLRAVIADGDGTLTPTTPSHPLSAYGNELVVRCGFIYPDGSEELLPMGIFRIEEATPSTDGRIEISGLDRSYVISQARFEKPFAIANGTNTVVAIQSIIDSRYPGLAYSAVATLRTTPATVFQEGDKSGEPWQNVQSIAGADGLDVYFDPDGQVVIRFEPDPTVDPVAWEHLSNEEGIMTALANKQSTLQAYNVAVVAGEGSDNVVPVKATVEITDPDSPVFPPVFGRRPTFLVSPFITTYEQALSTAQSLLQRKAGGSEEATFTAVPHPAHEAGDVVRIVNPQLAMDAFVVLKSFTIDLTLQQPTSYTTYARRTFTGAPE